MNRFEYIRAESVTEAATEMARPGSVLLAAGTNLLDLMKVDVLRPKRLIDITHLPDLDRIETMEDGSVRIGAMVRNSDLAFDETFAAAFPAVAEALLSGASPQLRNAATVGGNLLQRTRCRYFYDTASACNKRAPGAGCDAIDGENRGHAILGWSTHCIATHPSDFCVALAAFDATVEIESANDWRCVPLADFHRLPGDDPGNETVLAPGELIVAVRLPAKSAAFAGHARYLKVRERTSYAFALVSAAAGLDFADDGTIRAARIALGGVAPKPWRAEAAEAMLVGGVASPELFAEAGRSALADAEPSGDNAYKIELTQRVVARVLANAAAGTPDTMPALPASPFAPVSGGPVHA
ncbi:MAG: xanthine dehydrogenase family protein subunit M [Salinisphaera sp.]|uniref:FAD binding domain-containing protein n=1 Tax=Salinisphaera sp. TaxID=1914330 RepID=UPI003C7B3B4C